MKSRNPLVGGVSGTASRLGSVRLMLSSAVALLGFLVLASGFQQGGDGSTGSVNTGPPKKDGSVGLSITFTEPNQYGDLIGDQLDVPPIDVNGPPKNSSDDPQTTAADKASGLAGAINSAAASAGKPLQATAIGDTVVIQNTSTVTVNGETTNGTIGAINVDDKSREKDLLETHGAVAGEIELDGAVSGVGFGGPGALGSVTLTLGTTDYSVSTSAGQSLEDVLTALRDSLVADGLNARVSRGRLRVNLPAGVRKVGFESNDLTIDSWLSATDV